VDWGYLAKVIDENELYFRLQFVAGTEKVTGAPSDEAYVDVEKKCEHIFYLVPFEEEGQADVLPASQGDAELTSLIADDPSITSARSKGKPMEHRLEVLRLTLSEALKAWTKDWPDDATQLAKYDKLIEIANAAQQNHKDTEQARMSQDEKEALPELHLGRMTTNNEVVARTLLKIKSQGPPTTPSANQNESAILLELQKMQKLLKLNTIGRQGSIIDLSDSQPAPVAPTRQAGIITGFGDGLCLYNVLGGVAELSKDSQYDITKITGDHEKLVEKARCELIENWCSIAKILKEKNLDPTKIAQGIFGRTEQQIFEHVMDDAKQGGLLEAGLLSHLTNIEVRVITGDAITSAASDLQLKGATQSASFADLLGGEVKSRVVFLIVSGGKKQHYDMACIVEGDDKKALFKLGQEADDAHELIISMLKKKNQKSITNLEGEERRIAIQKKIVTYAQVLAGSNGASQPPAPAQAGLSKATQPPTPAKDGDPSLERCRNFEKNGMGLCSYGEDCKFEHDMSRSGLRRRKNIRQMLDEKRKIKEAVREAMSKDRSRSRRRRRGSNRSGRSTSSSSSGRSSSRSSHRPRSPSKNGNRRNRSHSRNRSRSSSRGLDDPEDEEWEQAGENSILVRCRSSVHPAAWRSSIQAINNKAYKMITWAERSPDKGWLTVECETGKKSEVRKMLQTQFEVKNPHSRRKGGGKGRSHHCANFLNGNACKHPAPYCK
jgi:hypothetical protein